ncbi:hypothetical protein [Microbacterium sp. Gd 4-13]|uniref:hypothetical protein n=1 Tax=Microbacterium sp. Gd 4-13 TaxID=2173179 RepID=UPI000E31D972|nr:hypothetical protein [Microbacterium sp. Gd 4-13]
MNDVTFVNTFLVVVAVLTAAGATAVAIWSMRRSLRSDTGTERPTLGRAETWAVSLVGAGGLMGIALSVYGLIASGIFLATSPSVRVTDVPMSGDYPAVLVASDAPVDAGYESAWIEVANLPGSTRMLLWLETALPAVTGLVIAVAIAWLAMALLRGTPFTRSFPNALGVVAIVVIGSGLGSQIAGSTARAETVAFLGDPRDITGPGGFVASSLALDLGPVGWGLGIALVAAAFSIGTRLQRENRRLV